MRYLLVLGLILTGCSTEDIRNGFAGGAAGIRAVQNQQEASKHGVDNTCETQCNKGGYSLDFCNNKCRY